MTRYALLLSGVNVGTRNSLPMAELRAMITKLGCTDVQTYVQSGNAVFGTNLSEAALTKAIEHALEAYLGRPIATTLRTLDHMKAIVDVNPFVKVATKPAHLCVMFLSHAPTKAEVAPLHAQEWRPELFKVAGNEIYTWQPNEQGRRARGCAREAALARPGHDAQLEHGAEARARWVRSSRRASAASTRMDGRSSLARYV